MMGIKTLVIAPYRGMAELVANMAPELEDFDITILQGDLTEVLPSLKQYEEEGYEIIISRGGTARLVREHTSIPLTEIKVSGFDIMRLLALIRGYQVKMEMIGFPNIIESVVAVANLMEMELPFTTIRHESEVPGALEVAKQKGAKVIIGDTVTVRYAGEAGLQGVLITSGRESVLEAFHDARNLHRVVQSHIARSEALANVMDRMGTGILLADEQGAVDYVNAAFYDLMGIGPQELKERSLFDRFPHVQSMLQDLQKESLSELPMKLYDPGQQQISIAGGVVRPTTGRPKYYLFVKSNEEKEEDISVLYPQKFIGSFPQLILAGVAFHQPMEEAIRRLEKGEPIVVYGERGTGKRLFAGALYDKIGHREGNLVEIHVKRGSDAAFERLKRFVYGAGGDTVLYIRGIESLPVPLQRQLVEIVKESKVRIVFSFVKSPQQLREEVRLDNGLYGMLTADAIEMPPLRERIEELEEYVRSFIVKYNERYGKQIVGVRPAAMEALRRHPWNGNMLELKSVIKAAVKAATGAFIDEEALDLLPRSESLSNGTTLAGASGRRLDLERPLEEIEKDIIRIVMEEENQNQSKAAKRLGINRSTLWRKIKEIEGGE